MMTLLPPPADMLVPSWHWLAATWFGTGLVEPLRAGLAVATAAAMVLFLDRRGKLSVPVFGLLILAVGVFVSSSIGEASGVKDDRRIVIDEVAAFVIGATFLGRAHWAVLCTFAALFLFIDRIKPWPFHHLEMLAGGWGVMADDLGLGLALGIVFFAALATRRTFRNA